MFDRPSDEVDGNRLTHRLINDTEKSKPNPRDYTELDDVHEEANKQYWNRETCIPWRAIGLAAFLTIGGTLLIVISMLVWSGFLVGTAESGEVLVPLGLGLLMFIPGFYHIRIAYHAYHRCHGFTFDDIPDFD